ncbi:MAG: NAD(P)/FAD-dependent oxidoreductase [Pseudomonadota bacterium]
MKVAVVGAGISGIVAAWELSREHDVEVFEAGSYPGGHTDTHSVHIDGIDYAVDSGFIVYNEENYPGFSHFLGELGVSGRDTEMSFAVHNTRTGLEYNATSLNRLFCQRKNLLNPRFYRMLVDLVRFYRQAPELLDSKDDTLTLGEYLRRHRYSRAFVEDHLIPMACALWSGPSASIEAFPARYFVQFMHNHRMLNLSDRPQWRTVRGGSQRYVDAWLQQFKGRIFCHSRVEKVKDTPRGVSLKVNGEWRQYDCVFMACHSDQALSLLSDPTPREREVLGGIAYQSNHMQLHSDTSVLPPLQEAWASWNARVGPELDEQCTVSYDMNILQGIQAPVEFIVSLNSSEWVDPGKVYVERHYQHPIYNSDTLRSQRLWKVINGTRGLYYCGAYWGWGFHEDGVQSAHRAVELFRQQGQGERHVS